MNNLNNGSVEVAWGPLHTLVVDMPPGTGDVQLSLCQNVPVQGALVITTPQTVATSDVRRGMQMLRTLKVPIFGIVENMTEFICPACGHRSPLFDHQRKRTTEDAPALSGADTLAQEMGVSILERIPLDPLIIEQTDAGIPVVLSHPNSEVTQAYRRLADKVINYQNKISHVFSDKSI